MYVNEISISGTFLTSRRTASISGRTVLQGVGELVMYFIE